ncbi:importin-5-like [Iris pallida]|uniref:Importin-5-like n=1 Tax=Iris pallida TaxID=29817 RepID=A0AAX6EC87_IRIPA|nr:importin-5-like [Iris pallida]
MKMLLDVEDELAWHSAKAEDEDGGDGELQCGPGVPRPAFDCSRGKHYSAGCVRAAACYLAAPEWQKHHAAMITVAQIAEGCSKVMLKNLEQVVVMVLNSFQDPILEYGGRQLMPLGSYLLIWVRTCKSNFTGECWHLHPLWMISRIHVCRQAHAASAVLNFSENCTPDILAPYLDGIVSKLLVLLQNVNQMVQEGALTALASVADSSQEHFQKYYDAVMPYLKAILMNATDKSNRMLRAKSMECISLVGMAVGKDKFRDDAKQVMEVLMSLQGSQMETDDPITSYMLQAWARLCKCLGQDFLPYMSVVMPPLLQSAQLKPDVTITSADSDDDIDESDDESIETITLGIKG